MQGPVEEVQRLRACHRYGHEHGPSKFGFRRAESLRVKARGNPIDHAEVVGQGKVGDQPAIVKDQGAILEGAKIGIGRHLNRRRPSHEDGAYHDF